MNRFYAKGARLEHRSRLWLLRRGALDVIGSKGSHGPWDLVARFADHTEWIQVKAKSSKLTGRALAKYEALAAGNLCASTLLIEHVWEPYAREPIVREFVHSEVSITKNEDGTVKVEWRGITLKDS